MQRRRRIVVAALALTLVLGAAACKPKPAPAPPPLPPVLNCFDSGTGALTIAQCHINYATYSIDPNPFAQTVAATIAASGTCANLGSKHTPGATLLAVYAGATSVGENLFCSWTSSGICPSNAQGATSALNGWLNSPGHKANMDGFAGASVVGGAACNAGVYVAVAQFHRP
ncbi:MAG: CAP domain-containing protein [Actinobacteria bacterium]|nr:CAP domain-containing protein [Actinomycetota bacterium]